MEAFKLPDRFWVKVDRSGGYPGCWNWMGQKDRDGYGKFKLKGKHCRVPRIVMESLGFDVDGWVVRHSCDNPSCCNPQHLAVGTDADNSRDMVERGRSNKGSKHPQTKLNEADVLRVRKIYSELPRGQKGQLKKGSLRQLAIDCALPYETLIHIVYRRTWKHI